MEEGAHVLRVLVRHAERLEVREPEAGHAVRVEPGRASFGGAHEVGREVAPHLEGFGEAVGPVLALEVLVEDGVVELEPELLRHAESELADAEEVLAPGRRPRHVREEESALAVLVARMPADLQGEVALRVRDLPEAVPVAGPELPGTPRLDEGCGPDVLHVETGLGQREALDHHVQDALGPFLAHRPDASPRASARARIAWASGLGCVSTTTPSRLIA